MGRRSSNPLNLWEFKYRITTSTPVDSEQIAIDSNWAFDHMALLEAHGISSFGATIVDDENLTEVQATLSIPTTAAELPWSDALYGIGESDTQGAIDYILTIMQDTREPTGFPNRTDSNISKVDGTRTFSIAPAVTNFDYYLSGVKQTVSSSDDIVWTDVEGIHHFYYDKDGGGLTHTTTFDPLIITEHAYVANLYWDATNKVAIRFGEERHGMNMDPDTHIWMHQNGGSIWISGLPLSNMIVDGSGSLNTHAQLGVVGGVIKDEDITHNIVNGSPQTLETIGQIPVFYLSGASAVWRKKTADNFPLIYNGTAGFAGTYSAYNQYTGGAWQLTDTGNNNFHLIHLFATNDLVEPVIAILGQDVYASAATARAAANSELNSLVVTGIPSQEFVAIATVIVGCKSTYTNTPKSIFVSTDDGSDYIDWRGTAYSPSGGISTGDHGNLAGLGDDDHTQYYNTTRGDARYLQIANIDDTPVDAEMSAPISSNWAFDHVNAANPHPNYLLIANIDDTPVNAETSAPISSNWAYDHAASTTAHGISSFGATLVDDASAAVARLTLGLVIGTNVQAYDANLPTWPSTVSATEVSYLDGVTSAIQTQLNAKLSTSAPSLAGDLECNNYKIHEIKSASFNGLYDNGTKSANFAVDFTNGQHQKVTLSASVTITGWTFPGVGVYILEVHQDAGGSKVPTLPSGKWPGGTTGTFSTGASAYDTLHIWYNGTSAHYQLATGWA